MGVSDQTIRNWNRAGLPACGKDERGRNLYDLDVARKFKEEYRGEPAHGGVRPGAGRKKGRRSWRSDWVGTGELSKEGLEFAERVASSAADEAAKKRRNEALQNARTHEEQLAILLLDPAEGGLTKAEAERVKAIYDAQAKKREEEVARGKLIESEDVRASWSAFLGKLSTALDQLVVNAAARVMAVGVPAEKSASVRAAILAAVEDVRGSLRERGEQKAA